MGMLGVKDFLDAQKEAAAMASADNIPFSIAMKRVTKRREEELKSKEKETQLLLDSMRETSENFINIFK